MAMNLAKAEREFLLLNTSKKSNINAKYAAK